MTSENVHENENGDATASSTHSENSQEHEKASSRNDMNGMSGMGETMQASDSDKGIAGQGKETKKTKSKKKSKKTSKQKPEDLFYSTFSQNSPSALADLSLARQQSKSNTMAIISNDSKKQETVVTVEGDASDFKALDDKVWTDMEIANNKNQKNNDNASENGDEAEEVGVLNEDSYRIIFLAKYTSLAFAYAAATIFTQIAIIVALLNGVFVKSGDDGNPLGVPPDVSPNVRMVAFLALMIAPGFMEDFLTSIAFLTRGYDPRIMEQKPHATFTKFILAGFLQLGTGVGLLLTIFALIMQSETVVSLTLNYAALHFVAEIDNVAFRMAKEGYLTVRVQQEMKQVESVRVRAHGSRTLIARRIAYAAACLALLAGYIRVTKKQNNGKYLCQKLFFQFGDEFNHEASAFSGVYEQDGRTKGRDSRVIYVGPKGFAKLGYCEDDTTWTLIVSEGYSNSSTTFDPCGDDWIVKSSPSEGYDVTQAADTPWFVSMENRRVEVIDHFHMKCIDCDANPVAGRSCSGSGQCVDNSCVCDEGYAGLQCEFSRPCTELTLDWRGQFFPESDNSGRGQSGYQCSAFDILKSDDESHNETYVQVYNRPIYVEGTCADPIFAKLIVYTGRRWIITENYNRSAYDLAELAQSFHSAFNPAKALFVSEEVDQGTPKDSLSPVGLNWYQPQGNTIEGLFGRADTSRPVDAKFLCGICDGDKLAPTSNPCFEGTCPNKNGVLDESGTTCSCENVVYFDNDATEANPVNGNLFMGYLCEAESSYSTFFVEDDWFRLNVVEALDLRTSYYAQNTTTGEWFQWRDGMWSTSVVWYFSVSGFEEKQV